MNALQYNVEYLSNKISNNSDRINNDYSNKYDQDDTNQGIWDQKHKSMKLL